MHLLSMMGAAVLLVFFTLPACAQIEQPTASELDAVPPQFLNLVHGKSAVITQNLPNASHSPVR